VHRVLVGKTEGKQSAFLIYFAAETCGHTEVKRPKHLWKENVKTGLQEI